MTTAGSYTETFVEVADVRLQLRHGGTGEPLLVLHGELGVPGWLRAYELLAEHFTVYVPSLPGFGQSARPDWIISVRDLAAWVHLVCPGPTATPATQCHRLLHGRLDCRGDRYMQCCSL